MLSQEGPGVTYDVVILDFWHHFLLVLDPNAKAILYSIQKRYEKCSWSGDDDSFECAQKTEGRRQVLRMK